VDSNGERVTDPRVNVLTVAASESYEQFVTRLQAEIAKEYGEDAVPPNPGNARKRTKLNLRKEYLLTPEFKALWDRIKERTRYSVSIDSEKLVTEVVAELSNVTVHRPRVVVQVARMTAGATDDVFEAIRLSDASVAIDLEGRFPLPNILSLVENLMEATSPPMRIGRKTILAIMKAMPNPQITLDNPHEFASALMTIIKNKLADQLIDGIQYQRDGTWYEQSQFDEFIDVFEANVVKSASNGVSGGTHLYDGVSVESDSVERPFAEALEKDARVKLYVKLPSWFEVPTPIGAYNPDWAIVMDEGDQKDCLYLIRETKGTTNLADLRPSERRKIACGRKHFTGTLGVSYKVVSDASQLPFGGI
jgi:type III restriction enzyme